MKLEKLRKLLGKDRDRLEQTPAERYNKWREEYQDAQNILARALKEDVSRAAQIKNKYLRFARLKHLQKKYTLKERQLHEHFRETKNW